MASSTYIQRYADGSSAKFKRKKQGRKPSGLGKAVLVRLIAVDEEKIKTLKRVHFLQVKKAAEHRVQRIAFGAFVAGVLVSFVIVLIIVFVQNGVR